MRLPVRLGTRGSPLALVQAGMAAAALRVAHGWDEKAIKIVPVRTSGDRIQDRPLAEVGGKALWTRELDEALTAGVIDLAVHSMKDVETVRPPEISIAALLPRADPRDRLIGVESIAALSDGARVGTSSPRRAAQLRRLRPDIDIIPFRGNVDTRLAKLARGDAEATILAAAGLDRLGRELGRPIAVDTMLPAPAQGVVGIEALGGRGDLLSVLSVIDDASTRACVMAERAFLAGLGADCRSPVAGLAVLEEGLVRLRGEILSIDGAHREAGETDEDPATLAQELLRRAHPALRASFAR